MDYIGLFSGYQTPFNLDPDEDPDNDEFKNYLRRGVYPKVVPRKKPRYYIWHSIGDNKVRESHSSNNGLKFEWAKPPETGHPGQEFNCLCWAESILYDE